MKKGVARLMLGLNPAAGSTAIHAGPFWQVESAIIGL